MSKKTVCEIPARWTLDDYARRPCHNRTHRHVTVDQAQAAVTDGAAIWIIDPYDAARRSIRERRSVKPIMQNIRVVATRGLSSQVGAVLFHALMRKEGWALAMFATIRGRREESSIDIPATRFQTGEPSNLSPIANGSRAV